LRKPGKEATRSGNKRKPNDMLPVVRKKGERRIRKATFKNLAVALHKKRPALKAAQLLGALLCRSAVMADHTKDRRGKWKYKPDPEVIKAISSDIPTIYAVPVEAFLHYVDALGWNEDVKYGSTKKGDKPKSLKKLSSRGRPNTLRTLAHIVAADIDAVKVTDVIGGLISGRGVAPLSQARARMAFPALKPPLGNRKRRKSKQRGR
jgi:hypothetical protein